jgi:predicted ester cyclase
MSHTVLRIFVVIGLVTFTSACLCGPCRNAETNKTLVLAALSAIQDQKFDDLDQFFAGDYLRHCQATPDAQVTSLDDFKAFLRADRETLPDQVLTVQRLVAEGDMVAFWMSYSGTQLGPMGPLPPTGGRIEVDIAGIHRVVGGRIAESWVTWDNLTALAQLGLWPPQPVAENPGP